MNTESRYQWIWNIANKGALPNDSDEVRLRKAVLTIISISITFLAIIWGALYIYTGYPWSGAIPLSYALISFISTRYFFRTKKFAFFRFSQLLLILLLPFALMWSLGGFAGGSAVMIWAFFTPLAALFFSDLKTATLWLLAFLGLTILSGLLDGTLIARVSPISETVNTLYFMMNMGLGPVLIFIVLFYFVKDRERSHQETLQSKEDAIHAKEALEQAYQQLQANENRIRELMLTDALTGIANRRALDERLTEEMKRVQRYGNGIAIIMSDIDHFKKVNDNNGHTTGDKVLQHFASLLHKEMRASDFVARFGGEEFILLLLNTDKEGAIQFAERLREIIKQSDIPELPYRLTASFGVTTIASFENNIAILERVDRALYHSKESGRNRVTYIDETGKMESAAV